MTRVRDRHAIVTGGSEGIGLATAALLLDGAARVSIVSRSPEKLAVAAAALEGRAHTAAADVTDPDALAAAFVSLVDEQGPCDVLVTSAGGAEPGYFEQLDADVFRRQMDLNFFGTLHAIRAVLPSMLERRRGHLVLLSSIAGYVGVFGYSMYCPTKFAVRGLGETLRAELGGRGVKVSIVYPPDTETPGLERENVMKPEETKRISAAIKPISAERVARAIVRGIERDRLHVTADVQSRLLVVASGLLGPFVRWQSDRIARRA